MMRSFYYSSILQSDIFIQTNYLDFFINSPKYLVVSLCIKLSLTSKVSNFSQFYPKLLSNSIIPYYFIPFWKICNSFNAFKFTNALDIYIAPSHSALFLAIANISNPIPPSKRPSDIYVAPLIPNPQLLRNSLLRVCAYFKKGFIASAPNGLTALFDKSMLTIYNPIKLELNNYKLD